VPNLLLREEGAFAVCSLFLREEEMNGLTPSPYEGEGWGGVKPQDIFLLQNCWQAQLSTTLYSHSVRMK